MDSISRLYFDLIGRDKGASKVMGEVGAKAQQAHTGLSKLGGSLMGLGGPFSSVSMLAGNLGDAMDGTLGKAQKLGLGITAVGVALTAFAANDQQAQSQLRTAIGDTGNSYADFRKGIEDAITTQEGFDHAANDTQDALNALTVATQDPTKALDELGFVADIAAEKHENLADAAKQLVLAQEGNLRALRSFGIALDGQGSKTAQLNRALKELQDRLAGQAGAAVDTFAGHLKVLGVRLEDDLAKLGKFGPEITAAGAALTAYASILQLVAARKLRDVLATEAETTATTELAAARLADAGAAEKEMLAGGRLLRFGKVLGGVAVGAVVLDAYAHLVGLGHKKQQYGPHGTPVGDDGAPMPAGKFGPVAIPTGTAGHQANNVATDTAATNAARDAQEKYAKSLMNEGDAAKKAAVGLNAHIKALQDTISKSLDLSSAEDGLQTGLHDLAQSVHDGSKALRGHSLAASGNRDALRNLAKQELDVITSLKAHGVSAVKVRAAAVEMSKAIRRNAIDILGNKQAVDRFLHSIGILPQQIANSLSPAITESERIGEDIMNALGNGIQIGVFNAQQSAAIAGASVAKQMRLAAGLDSAAGPTTAPFTAPPTSTTDAATKYAKHLAKVVAGAYAPAVDTSVEDATKKALEKAKQLLAQQAAFMRSELQQIIGAYHSTKQGLVDAASLANRQQGTDILGASGPAQSILAAKRQFAHQLVQFAHLLHRLEGAHYSRAIIDEVESLGAAAGIDAARELLAGGRKERREINRAERRIQAASGRIASQITSADYEAEILKALQKLPDQFDRKFERTLARLNITTDTGKQDRKQGHRVRAA